MTAKPDETIKVVIEGIKQIVDKGDRGARYWIGSSLAQELERRIGISINTSTPSLKILRSLGVLTREEIPNFKAHGNTKLKGKQWRWTLVMPNAVVWRDGRLYTLAEQEV